MYIVVDEYGSLTEIDDLNHAREVARERASYKWEHAIKIYKFVESYMADKPEPRLHATATKGL